MSDALVKYQPTAMSFGEVEQLSSAMAASNLFPGIKTKEAAFTLMMISQADGIHPAHALQRYHIINGVATRKSESLMQDFRRAGGKVTWHERNDACVDATFSINGESIRVKWDDQRCKQAQLSGNHFKFPTQMKTARCISEAVRLLCPDITGGMYTPEEMEDVTDQQTARPVQQTIIVTQQATTPPPPPVIPPAAAPQAPRKPWYVQAADDLTASLTEGADVSDIVTYLEKQHADSRKAPYAIQAITPHVDQLIAAGYSDALIRMGIIQPAPVQQQVSASSPNAEIEDDNGFPPAPVKPPPAEGSPEWFATLTPDAQAKNLIDLLATFTKPDELPEYHRSLAPLSAVCPDPVKKRDDVRAAFKNAWQAMGYNPKAK